MAFWGTFGCPKCKFWSFETPKVGAHLFLLVFCIFCPLKMQILVGGHRLITDESWISHHIRTSFVVTWWCVCIKLSLDMGVGHFYFYVYLARVANMLSNLNPWCLKYIVLSHSYRSILIQPQRYRGFCRCILFITMNHPIIDTDEWASSYR